MCLDAHNSPHPQQESSLAGAWESGKRGESEKVGGVEGSRGTGIKWGTCGVRCHSDRGTDTQLLSSCQEPCNWARTEGGLAQVDPSTSGRGDGLKSGNDKGPTTVLAQANP